MHASAPRNHRSSPRLPNTPVDRRARAGGFAAASGAAAPATRRTPARPRGDTLIPSPHMLPPGAPRMRRVARKAPPSGDVPSSSQSGSGTGTPARCRATMSGYSARTLVPYRPRSTRSTIEAGKPGRPSTSRSKSVLGSAARNAGETADDEVSGGGKSAAQIGLEGRAIRDFRRRARRARRSGLQPPRSQPPTRCGQRPRWRSPPGREPGNGPPGSGGSRIGSPPAGAAVPAASSRAAAHFEGRAPAAVRAPSRADLGPARHSAA